MSGEIDRPTDAVAALFLDEGDLTLLEDVLPIGTLINNYEIEAKIGSGGTGIVYAATHRVIGKRVAIKVLRRELCDEPVAVERFVLEARTVNAIGHPNIVDIFDLGTLADGRQFLVMDLLQGRTLRRRLAEGPLHLSEATAVIDRCCSALIAAHGKGFVHRDLKPDNVFVVDAPDRDLEIRVLDFGIVKLAAATNPRGGGVRTKNGVVIGTPNYMSPEQAIGKDVDHRTDIYALGVMSFELLAGRRPYVQRNVLDLLIAHAEAPIPSLRALVPALPIEVAQLVEAMLAKRADDRPTLAAVRTVLKRLKGSVIPSLSAVHGLPTEPTQVRAPSAGLAMNAMPVYVPTLDAPLSAKLPRVIPKGTPSKTQTVEEAAIIESVGSRSRWWLVVAAALLVAAGVVLGMSL